MALATFAIIKIENAPDDRGKESKTPRVMDSEAKALRLADAVIHSLDEIDESILPEIGMRVFMQLVPSGNS